jgi:hypothetical protein
MIGSLIFGRGRFKNELCILPLNLTTGSGLATD